MLIMIFGLGFILITSAKCIIVPLILNVIFPMYVNFMIFGFKGLAFVICLV